MDAAAIARSRRSSSEAAEELWGLACGGGGGCATIEPPLAPAISIEL